ncbi:RNA 2',3'-cyclic phosphodiesterase [Pseudomonas sp. RW407]|uniref:RNA 2',3'-cyclic phosphodiesterase n=1 Tax=Pseudomonas sp. RW407 TaxID=2202894 RepID=UPI000D6F917A|nr:RNA 2',3'-cyclic phosphodiesterase [Pseudomonas sp. RW407]PWU29832.1 RNA 2',3'-cyclic phosphodiesterase [Pseudomonas sp. RW407]
MSTPPLRLFFALPCPEEIRAPLAAWRDGLAIDGQPVTAANLHLTLAFLGAVPRARKAELLALGASLPRTPFELFLDRLERWRNGILHLAPTNIPPALPSLVQALQDVLQVGGFETERRPFRPHLTLARHCRRTPEATARFAWPARELVLYSSENSPHGVHYRAIGRWPLDGEPLRND